jgi:hypothetical protein
MPGPACPHTLSLSPKCSPDRSATASDTLCHRHLQLRTSPPRAPTAASSRHHRYPGHLGPLPAWLLPRATTTRGHHPPTTPAPLLRHHARPSSPDNANDPPLPLRVAILPDGAATSTPLPPGTTQPPLGRLLPTPCAWPSSLMVRNKSKVESCITKEFKLKEITYSTSVYFIEYHNVNAPTMRYHVDEDIHCSDLQIFQWTRMTVNDSTTYQTA